MEQTILGNRYQIIKKIGDGGMAFVYQAKDKLLNRIVAVKVLRPEFVDDKDFLAKFKREAEAVANITHPNIVNVYDVGQEGKVHYIVMEYVDGQNLKEIIKNEGVLDEYTALDITKQIAQALSAAHKKGVIHRDIKPHNILISNEERQVKVADFGIAKAVSNSTITNIGSIIGSVHYFSPEQAKGQPVSNNADLYSLGIVLYEMLIGRVPFRGDSPISIALQHINENIEFTPEEKTKIPHSIRTLISKMTEKNAEDRYQSAEEVIEDIEYIEKNIDLDFIKEYDNYVTQKIDQDKLLVKSKKYYTGKKYQEEELEDYEEDEEYEDDYYYEEEKPKRRSSKPNSNINKNGNKNKRRKKKSNTGKIVVTLVALLVVVGCLVAFGSSIIGGLSNGNSDNSGSSVESFNVPNFVNLYIDDASRQAANLGLNIQQSEEYNVKVEKGRIISQTPQTGKVQQGDTINVVVSLGGKEASVPNVVGISYEKAKKIIEDNNLTVGSRSYEYSTIYEEGVVIWQNPASGTSGVLQNTKVDLAISKGKKPEPTNTNTNNNKNDNDNNSNNNNGNSDGNNNGNGNDGNNNDEEESNNGGNGETDPDGGNNGNSGDGQQGDKSDENKQTNNDE